VFVTGSVDVISEVNSGSLKSNDTVAFGITISGSVVVALTRSVIVELETMTGSVVVALTRSVVVEFETMTGLQAQLM